MYIIIIMFDFGIGNFQKEAPAQLKLLSSAMGKKSSKWFLVYIQFQKIVQPPPPPPLTGL